jgi:hypothetical protein
LPGAWITGKGVLQQAAAWLFRVTGQCLDWHDRFLDPFRSVGFYVNVKRVELESSYIVIINAIKRIT